MKKLLGKNMKHSLMAGAVITLLAVISLPVSGQAGKEVSLSLYPGFTPVNFEKALGYSDDYMEDWDQIHYGVAARGFLLWDKSFEIGAELAWQRLYYAYYIIPYVPSNLYREFNVSTFSLTVLARYWMGKKIFIIGGLGMHLFNDGIAPSLSFEAGYMLKLSETLKMPLSLRFTPILGDGTPMPVSIGVGAAYSF